MIIINNIRKLYKKWKKENKHFVKFGYITKSKFEEASDSFVCYLRTHNVTLAHANLAIDSLNCYSELSDYIVSFVLGLITSNTLEQKQIIQAPTPLLTIISIFLYSGVILFGIKVIQKTANDIAYSKHNFLCSVLQRYKDLYADELQYGHKIIQVANNVKVKIPIGAESIYGERMQSPKYYQNAFHIIIKDNQQEFAYIWYSNKNYNSWSTSTKNDFVRLCEKQIGKDWGNINNQNITFKKLDRI